MNDLPTTSAESADEFNITQVSTEDKRIASLLSDLELMGHDKRTIEKKFDYSDGLLEDYVMHQNKTHLINVLEAYKEMVESGEMRTDSDAPKSINVPEENLELVTILENTIQNQKKYILFLEYELKKILPNAPDDLYELYKKNQLAQSLKRY